MNNHTNPEMIASSTVVQFAVAEAAKHARTQTRFRGPDTLVAWHCDCGESGTASGRKAAIAGHREHIHEAVKKAVWNSVHNMRKKNK